MSDLNDKVVPTSEGTLDEINEKLDTIIDLLERYFKDKFDAQEQEGEDQFNGVYYE